MLFGLFSSCNVDEDTRQWIEQRWHWLAEQFGREILLRSPILPTCQFFPDAYDRSDEAARLLLKRACDYMQVDHSRVDLEFYSNARQLRLVNEEGDAIATTAGTYHRDDDRFIIRIERGQLDLPMTLVGTVAHELAHARLLGEGRLNADEFDHELTTDLTVVFHGMGIFLANVPRTWKSSFSTWPDTQRLKPEYMTAAMYGYALALRCHDCGDLKPRWRGHLQPGVRAEFKQALRYLIKSKKTKKTGNLP